MIFVFSLMPGFSICEFVTRYPDGSFLNVSILNSTFVRFHAEVPNNHYLGIGFGTVMANSDMIIW
jgi:hypothetical protein